MAKVRKQILELGLVSAFRKSLNENVVVRLEAVLALLSFLFVREHFQRLALKVKSIRRLDSLRRISFLIKLDVGESTGSAIRVALEFALGDWPVVLVQLKEFLLGHGRWQVAHEYVGLGVGLGGGLQRDGDGLAADFCIVKGLEASLGLVRGQELRVAVLAILLGALVLYDEGFVHAVTLLLDKFE